jgi:hypothetical protein
MALGDEERAGILTELTEVGLTAGLPQCRALVQSNATLKPNTAACDPL